jgi:hypothetical protein
VDSPHKQGKLIFVGSATKVNVSGWQTIRLIEERARGDDPRAPTQARLRRRCRQSSENVDIMSLTGGAADSLSPLVKMKALT